MKKKIASFFVVLFLLLAGNALAVTIDNAEVFNSRNPDGTFSFETDVYLSGESTPGSSTVKYSVNGAGPFTMDWYTWGSYEFYRAPLLNPSTTGWSSPSEANGKTFTWTADGLTASGTVPDGAIRPMGHSYDQKVLDANPAVNKIEWYNDDPNIDEYRVRLFDGSNNYLDNENIISSSDSYIIHDYTGFTFIPGVDYKFRIEAREYGNLEGDGTYTNRSVAWLDYKPVPEPATMLLFSVGLLGLAGFGRKRFKK